MDRTWTGLCWFCLPVASSLCPHLCFLSWLGQAFPFWDKLLSLSPPWLGQAFPFWTSFLVCPLRGWVRPFLSGTSFLVCPPPWLGQAFPFRDKLRSLSPPWLGQAFPFRDKLLSLSPPWLQRSLWFGSQSVTSRISGIVIFFVSSKILYYFNQ